MLLFFAKFVLFYVFCSVAFALFKVMYYNISKKWVTKTAEGTKLNWALNVFLRFIYKKLPKKDRDPCRDAATTELQRLLLFSLADLTVLRYHHTILNRC